MIKNTKVYGLSNAIKVSKYPMSTDIKKLNNDLTNRVTSLAKSKIGEGHDNFLNGIIVQFDLTASNKFWVEFQRYHFIDFISSQSTMHRIINFDLDNSFLPFVDKRIIEILKEKVEDYKKEKTKEKYLEVLYSVPSGFRLTAGITTNYRQLKTIYLQRKNHKLPEWRIFCRWIENLPFHEWITNNQETELSSKYSIKDDNIEVLEWKA